MRGINIYSNEVTESGEGVKGRMKRNRIKSPMERKAKERKQSYETSKGSKEAKEKQDEENGEQEKGEEGQIAP